jgi:hypothetical protein
MAGPSLDELRVTARYHRDRLALYRARAYSARPTTQMKLMELERSAQSAENRLRLALKDAADAADAADAPPPAAPQPPQP